jgi:membrane protein implicated in regulation of membrane protease activity
MFSNYWWVWAIIAALFIVGEILTFGFFLLWFGVGAIVAGVAALLGVALAWQLAIFIVVSFVLFAVSRKFAERFSKEQPPGIGADRFIGKTCVVLVEINNDANTGRVRLVREEWRAESDDGSIIPVDTKVVVVRIHGTQLVVKRATEGE